MSLSLFKPLTGAATFRLSPFPQPAQRGTSPLLPGPRPVTATAPLISVVIPTYNYAHLVPRALDSVLHQWAADLELLVVDDGSQDDTAEVLQAYVNGHGSRVKVIRQANAGAAAARNRGIAQVSGRYVLLLDADDELVPGAFDALRQALRTQADAAMVLGAQITVGSNGNQRLRLPTPVWGGARQRCQRYLLDKTITVSHSRCLFRRDLLLQRPYPQQLRSGEDVAVFAYLLVSGSVVTTAQPVAKVHKHDDSLRHCRADEEAVALGMVREVFASLPASCQPLRQRYVAQRYLSLFRAAWLADDVPAARRFYRQAVRLSLRQALCLGYLSKFLRLVWR